MDSTFLKKQSVCFGLERGEGREKEKERNINVWEDTQSVASRTPPPGDLAHNPGMCPNWESNQWPFGSQAGAESTEPGLYSTFLIEWINDLIKIYY